MSTGTRRQLQTSTVPQSTEQRLQEIRQQAQSHGLVAESGARPFGAPFPQASAERGYYGLPLLKDASWKFEIPAYFFAGGAAGAAAVIASAASFLTPSERTLVRDARWLAAIGGAISPALLIADLGVPARFLNMLRVFKLRSPMSIGSWTLVAFSSNAAAAAFAASFSKRVGPLRMMEMTTSTLSMLLGLALATYTGVLIGATSIPVWNRNVSVLPAHFGASGLGAAVSILELKGHASNPALNALGIASALAETAVGARLELDKHESVAPLKSGKSGWLTRIGGLLSGPLPLALRLIATASGRDRALRLRRMAAAATVTGSFVTRYAWIQAGRVSSRDSSVPLQLGAKQPVVTGSVLRNG